MQSVILTVNSGSTSVRLAAFEVQPPASLTGVAQAAAPLRHIRTLHQQGADLDAGALLTGFMAPLKGAGLRAVAHRVVHGGTQFTEPALIDARVERELHRLAQLAPLHNPPALRWIAAAREACGAQARHVAVFDTAFFASLPALARRYALPERIGTAIGVQRYGFHGIAHESLWRRWCSLHPELPQGGRLISLQLGGGCSIAALAAGRPQDVSMGFSPLEGLVMATRCGDLDAAIVPYLEERLDLSGAEVVELLNRECGLLGLSGKSGDLNALLADDTEAARFAVDLYCYRARKYIGACLAVLGGCDGIVFGGGVGEHLPAVRSRILDPLRWAGIGLDATANAGACGGEARIDSGASPIAIHVLEVDEEAELARAAYEFLNKG